MHPTIVYLHLATPSSESLKMAIFWVTFNFPKSPIISKKSLLRDREQLRFENFLCVSLPKKVKTPFVAIFPIKWSP